MLRALHLEPAGRIGILLEHSGSIRKLVCHIIDPHTFGEVLVDTGGGP